MGKLIERSSPQQARGRSLAGAGRRTRETRRRRIAVDHNNGGQDPAKLHAPIEEIAKKFGHAASIVSHSTADSALQRTGRHNWVGAVDEISSGFYNLGRALHDTTTGDKAAASRLLTVAQRKINNGGKLLYKADRELHLRRGD